MQTGLRDRRPDAVGHRDHFRRARHAAGDTGRRSPDALRPTYAGRFNMEKRKSVAEERVDL